MNKKNKQIKKSVSVCSGVSLQTYYLNLFYKATVQLSRQRSSQVFENLRNLLENLV